MTTLILFNKPFNVLSQFTDNDARETLADYIDTPNVYPAGRLDKDSEGLLLLTDDGKLQQQISHPKYKSPKTYWAQVEGIPNDESLAILQKGVLLKDGKTRPAKANIISEPNIWDRHPPIRFRKNKPTSWIELEIKEGKNRQVRRMTAAIGHPTLRLIRYKIGQWCIDDLLPGQHRTKTLEK
ncbi:MAG: pseudouridine synthase [Cellvibrionaceae bacterium]